MDVESMTFRHTALFYAGVEEFVSKTSKFVLAGVEAGEPTLVVVSEPKIRALRAELGPAAAHVEFADMSVIGNNPARIIPAWQDFLDANRGDDVRIRGVGEPIGPDRTASQLIECQHHERLLNLAFQSTPGFTLACPYDTTTLDPAVITEARRAHAFVHDEGDRPNFSFEGLEFDVFDVEMPPPPAEAFELTFVDGMLDQIRETVQSKCCEAGISTDRCRDFVLSVNEVATNSLMHGGGTGDLRLWIEPAVVICEIRDKGRFDEPLVGRVRPTRDRAGGFGLWIANHLCDLVQLRSSHDGAVIRLHMQRR